MIMLTIWPTYWSPVEIRAFASLQGVVPCMSWHWSGTTRLKFASLPVARSVPSWVSGTMFATSSCVFVKFTNGLCFEAYSASVLLGHLKLYGPFGAGVPVGPGILMSPVDGTGGRFWK